MIKKLIASALLAIGLVVVVDTTSDALETPGRLLCVGAKQINNMICPQL